MKGKVRRIKLRHKLSNDATAKRATRSRNTVKKRFKAAADKVRRYSTTIAESKFTAFEGVLEKNVKEGRGRIRIEARTRRFGPFIDLNAGFGGRCRTVWTDTPRPVHKQRQSGIKARRNWLETQRISQN